MLMKRSSNLSQRLYVVESGTSGSNLVFLPGLGGTTRYWQDRLAPFEQAYHILLVDTLGFGQSPKPWTRYTVERHVDALHRSLARHAPFTLIGHSMGAILSLAYAARYPEQVERLVLLGLPYFGNREQTTRYFHNGPFLERWFLTNMALATVACIITRRLFGRILPYLLPDMPREVAEDLLKHSWLSFTSSLWEVIYNYDLKRNADRLANRLPIFCLHGDRDQTAPLEGVQRLAGGRPNWHVQVLAGADHHPLLHMHNTCLEAIELTLMSETTNDTAVKIIEK
jgi:pimeloyl-ACP methyl ester carboxylesterase